MAKAQMWVVERKARNGAWRPIGAAALNRREAESDRAHEEYITTLSCRTGAEFRVVRYVREARDGD